MRFADSESYRTNTERRKRSTLSQYTSPNTFHRSLRRQFSNGHRLLQSVNASKSAPGSLDECIQINSSLPSHGSQRNFFYSIHLFITILYDMMEFIKV